MVALTSRVSVALSAAATSALDLVTASAPLTRTKQIDLASGTGAGKADLVWSDQRTINASSSENLDLTGSLTDAFGATIAFARIKVILVEAASGNTNNVVVGGAASNTFLGPFGDATDTLSVQPDNFYLQTAKGATAWPVTADTGDILKIANSSSGTPVTYSIVLIGASA